MYIYWFGRHGLLSRLIENCRCHFSGLPWHANSHAWHTYAMACQSHARHMPWHAIWHATASIVPTSRDPARTKIYTYTPVYIYILYMCAQAFWNHGPSMNARCSRTPRTLACMLKARRDVTVNQCAINRQSTGNTTSFNMQYVMLNV